MVDIALFDIIYIFLYLTHVLFTEISETSLILMIDAIVSKLKIDIVNHKKLKLIDAIKQLSVNSNKSGESLTTKYLTMISNEDELKLEVSKQQSRMQRLQGTKTQSQN